MCSQILSIIGLLAVGGGLVWLLITLSNFIPDLIKSVEFYRRHKNEYGDDKVTNLKITQDKIIAALSNHLNLYVYGSMDTSYYGPTIFNNRVELDQMINEHIKKSQRTFKKQEAEKKAKKKKK